MNLHVHCVSQVSIAVNACRSCFISLELSCVATTLKNGLTQRVLSTSIVECRVPILGITIKSWEGIPITVPLDPVG